MSFIVFNTYKQAKNFLKRKHKSYTFLEGCGCCSYHKNTFVDKKSGNVCVEHTSENMGFYETRIEVVGKIKNKRTIPG